MIVFTFSFDDISLLLSIAWLSLFLLREIYYVNGGANRIFVMKT